MTRLNFSPNTSWTTAIYLRWQCAVPRQFWPRRSARSPPRCPAPRRFCPTGRTAGPTPAPNRSRPAPPPPNSRCAPSGPAPSAAPAGARPARRAPPAPAAPAGRDGGGCGQRGMETAWGGWRGGGGAPYDVAEPSHHMTAPADEAVPPAPVPGGTARLPLAPGERRGAGPGTAARSSCGDEVSSGRRPGWLSPPAPAPPRPRSALPAGDGCGPCPSVRGCPACPARPAPGRRREGLGALLERGASCSAGAAPLCSAVSGSSSRSVVGLSTDPGARRAPDTCRAAVTETNNIFFLSSAS